MYSLLYADRHGVLYEDAQYQASAWTGTRTVPLTEEQLIPLPPGTDIVMLPGRPPVGWDRGPVDNVAVKSEDGQLCAVAALLPVGFTRTLLPAYAVSTNAPALGLFGYTAVTAKDGEFFVAAVHTDEEYRWNPLLYNDRTLPRRIKQNLKKMPRNRLAHHLANCALNYHCLTAQNMFYSRWEAGIPVSPTCNADCFGCISRQPSECCPSPQERIKFIPSADEVTELGVLHLDQGVEPIISFGQGCEGEPLMQAALLENAMRRIRRQTSRGTINLNTNGSDPEAVVALAAAGLGSIRVSLFSARTDVYQAYHQPRGFGLDDVRQTIAAAAANGVYVSLNLLVMPGFTDRESEITALENLLGDQTVHMVQLRNLNIDPEKFFTQFPREENDTSGITGLISRLQRFSGLKIGNFTTVYTD